MDFTERERRLSQENRLLKQLLVDADAVARQRGDEYGLCDAIHSKTKEVYPSATMGNLLKVCVAQGFKPALTLDEALRYEQDLNSPWHQLDVKSAWSETDLQDFSNASIANAE